MNDVKNKRYIFTVTAGRSGQETLTNILNNCVSDTCALFEAPAIDTVLKGRFSNVEHKIRRKYFETNELLGRGRVLSAYDNNNITFINKIASIRINMINKKLNIENKSIYIDVSKYFARGLHIGFCKLLPKISVINLVRDPLMNMKSFMNRQKKFLLDNNLPESRSNILKIDSSSMRKEEFYLWAWCEMYLRFQHIKKEKCVDSYTEILTEKLDNNDYLTESLKLIGLKYNPYSSMKLDYNTNISKGYLPTSITADDVDIFYNFIKKIPSDLIKDIPYLDGYNPENFVR